MPSQLQSHQLNDRDRVRRSPRCHGRVKEQHFRRSAPQCLRIDLVKARVYPGGIGLKSGACLGVHSIHRLHRQRIDIEAAQQLVHVQSCATKDLTQPSLSSAAQSDHLPHTILGMGKTKAKINICVCRAKDMGHIGIVAHNLDRRPQPAHVNHIGVIGQ